jgi:hypothetical protein
MKISYRRRITTIIPVSGALAVPRIPRIWSWNSSDAFWTRLRVVLWFGKTVCARLLKIQRMSIEMIHIANRLAYVQFKQGWSASHLHSINGKLKNILRQDICPTETSYLLGSFSWIAIPSWHVRCSRFLWSILGLLFPLRVSSSVLSLLSPKLSGLPRETDFF